jgi:hypothetical protein
MAKKSTKKIENVEVKVEASEENISKDNVAYGGEDKCCCSDASFGPRKMKYLTPMELEAYEHMLKMLVLYYEQNLRLDESEGRPVMSENRNRYTRLSILHKRLMKYIENKVTELENYDWEN